MHPIIRKLFTKSIPIVPLAGRLAYFIAAWEKITQDQEILSIVKGYEIPFVSLPFPEKTPNLIKNVKRTIFIGGTGSFGNVGERIYPKSSTHTRAISEQPLPCRKKDGGNRPVINLKNLNKFIPYEHFKIESLHCLKFLLEFAIQNRSQGGIFFSSPKQKFSKVCQISMVRQPIPISLPMFWTRASSKNFYKIIKSSNDPLETGQHLNHYLPRRYLANGEEILVARDPLIFLLQHLGFVINLKKSFPHPVKQIEFLGLETEKMTLTPSEKKLKHVSQQRQVIFTQPKTSVLNLKKVIGLLSSTVQVILPTPIQFRYLQQEQILALHKKGPTVVM